MALSEFTLSDSSLIVGLEGAGEEVYADATEVILRVASDSLDYAKANAPWEDRTGAARDGLNVEVDTEGDFIVLQLFHTVDYGLWLEVIQNGRFAILMPTLENFTINALRSHVESVSEDES